MCPECIDLLHEQPAMFGFGGDSFHMSAAAHMYAGPGGALVRLLKYNNVATLRREMAADMLGAAEAAGFGRPDAVTFVPMHWRRRRGRYFDQAELLAREVAAGWGMKAEKLLKRLHGGRNQAGIHDDAERRRRMAGAFAALPEVKGKHVLLIDDVYTTGATSMDCARALKEAGAASISLLVYALAHTAGGVPLCDDGPRPLGGEELPF